MGLLEGFFRYGFIRGFIKIRGMRDSRWWWWWRKSRRRRRSSSSRRKYCFHQSGLVVHQQQSFFRKTKSYFAKNFAKRCIWVVVGKVFSVSLFPKNISEIRENQGKGSKKYFFEKLLTSVSVFPKDNSGNGRTKRVRKSIFRRLGNPGEPERGFEKFFDPGVSLFRKDISENRRSEGSLFRKSFRKKISCQGVSLIRKRFR